MKSILVTGGMGFIGFNALQQWRELMPDVELYDVDCETYAAKWMRDTKLKWMHDNGIAHVVADISNEYAMHTVIEPFIKHHHVDTIVNFCAESHVDNSVSSPRKFFDSNVTGAVNMLEMCRKHGCRMHQVSTDEVIGAVSPESGLDATEEAKLCPSSPYSSSKAAAELAAMSYAKTFGVHVTVSRCTNNIGEFQHPEKLVPKTILNALAGKKIPVYGAGDQRRLWIDVRSHNEALLEIIKNGKPGETYNIAPKPENLVRNIDMVKTVLEILGKSESLIEHVTDRPAHDTCYWLDPGKTERELGWRDSRDFRTTLQRTVEWYAQMNKAQ